ncbi:Core-2/I-branching beta-1,6-N-acetylglucosaminyltransferase family protein isoform 3 [Hibiscus syriacus]|uniref:Core-2/I-branching beta-1,6-N-acetylglucosaminyltransferase family protein isoform 3 n=1 Tax=Hibiscus syriacus TaxID=106335 RepID=A0A6A3B1F2_HIBSY|nr:Core-2/I-branching beta-1,6-N-acetylglucosaminyltransferase family protein isoform 3 [Hibiscus syriacus]
MKSLRETTLITAPPVLGIKAPSILIFNVPSSGLPIAELGRTGPSLTLEELDKACTMVMACIAIATTGSGSVTLFASLLITLHFQPTHSQIQGTLPLEALWAKFFEGHEGRFSVYVHASREKPVHTSQYFKGRDIRSEPVVWGKISMVDAERRLSAHALSDPDNQQFVLLSESCIPLQNFDYVYNYLTLTNVSFIDCFEDLGPHGSGRYSEHMMPEVEKKDFRKGSQMIDPDGIANRSVTYVDWSERRWHPKSFKPEDITLEFLKNLTSIDDVVHFTSDSKRVLTGPCMWNGIKRPCYLFARKFYPETLDKLMLHFSNYTTHSV